MTVKWDQLELPQIHQYSYQNSFHVSLKQSVYGKYRLSKCHFVNPLIQYIIFTVTLNSLSIPSIQEEVRKKINFEMVKCPQKTTDWLCVNFDKFITYY